VYVVWPRLSCGSALQEPTITSSQPALVMTPQVPSGASDKVVGYSCPIRAFCDIVSLFVEGSPFTGEDEYKKRPISCVKNKDEAGIWYMSSRISEVVVVAGMQYAAPIWNVICVSKAFSDNIPAAIRSKAAVLWNKT
jgi:hypothetical protein